MPKARTTIPATVPLKLRSGDRRAMRKQVVEAWLREQPGDRHTRRTYDYTVEKLCSGDTITLSRPTRLNKGMDFVITCSGFTRYKNGKPKPPTHKDLEKEVAAIATWNQHATRVLRRALADVWSGKDPDYVLKRVPPEFNRLELERALKLAKWMFIEQDLTYWTESGRWMLREGLEEIVGAFA